MAATGTRLPLTAEDLRELLGNDIEGNPGKIAPHVLVHQNVDPTKIEAVWVGDLHIKQDKVTAMLAEEGYTVLSIQTEFHGVNLGSSTIVYLVKLRS